MIFLNSKVRLMMNIWLNVGNTCKARQMMKRLFKQPSQTQNLALSECLNHADYNTVNVCGHALLDIKRERDARMIDMLCLNARKARLYFQAEDHAQKLLIMDCDDSILICVVLAERCSQSLKKPNNYIILQFYVTMPTNT